WYGSIASARNDATPKDHVGCAKSPCEAKRTSYGVSAILRTQSAARNDHSPNRPWISARSPPQSASRSLERAATVKKEHPAERRYRDMVRSWHEPTACAKSRRLRCQIAAPDRAILHTLRAWLPNGAIKLLRSAA